MLFILNFTSLPSTLNVISPVSISIKAVQVVRNGLPKRMGASESSSISMIMKSTGNNVSSTRTSTSCRTPYGYTLVRSARISVILVGFTSPQFSFFIIESGIRFTLAPKSHNALP
ncbi:hypothetical protein A2U01_0059012, partial [Trifolium medium]|nr:hypothetical protein [Trifolium medium]